MNPRNSRQDPRRSVDPRLKPILFGAPYIGEEEIREVVDTLRSGWIGTGPKTNLFETAFAAYTGSQFALGTNSGTAALHLSLNALGIEPGSEVITTPLTFVATANVIEHSGAVPVFVDVSPYDGNIDIDQAVGAINERTQALLPVHYAGALADVPALTARVSGTPVVVDAAHAVEGRYPSGLSSAGHGAVCTAYSFYATKNLVTGEGGMVVTDDEELAARMRTRSLHGLDNDAWKRYSSVGYADYDVEAPGFKYNMTDIQASLGLHQLERIELCHRRRGAVWEIYNEGFADLEGVTIPPVACKAHQVERHSRHLYTLWLDWDLLGLDRAQVVVGLKDEGIGTGWHFKAVHTHRYYKERYGYKPGDFPNAEAISSSTLSLPMSAALTEADAERVVDSVLRIVHRYR